MKDSSTERSGTARGARVSGLSYLRAAACVAIITLHTVNAAEILYRDRLSLAQLTASMAVVYVMMWAVPCFVMVSGALLLDPAREVTLEKIFRKYLLRVVGALLLFGLIYRGFDLLMNREPFSLLSLLKGLANVFTGQSWAHLWYLYLLVGLYLLLPFYRMVAKESSERLLRYLLLVYVVFLSLLPLTRMANVESAFYIHVSTIYPFYLFAGYAVSSGALRLSRPAAAGAALGGTVLIVLASILRFRLPAERLDEILASYSSMFVILQSVGMFSLLCSGDETAARRPSSAFGRLLLFIDENSFGVYLIHMIWIRLLLRYLEINPYEIGLWLFPVLILGNLAVSCLVTWALRRIPGMKRIL